MTRDNDRFSEVFPEVTGLFGSLPTVVAQTNTQTSVTDTTATTVTGMKILIPQHEFQPGATYKFMLAGTKSGTAGNLNVQLFLNNTSVLSLTSSSSAAGDWRFEGYVSSIGPAKQNCFGIFTQTTVASVFDYAAATVATVGDCPLKAVITQGNTDTTTVEYGRIEYVLR